MLNLESRRWKPMRKVQIFEDKCSCAPSAAQPLAEQLSKHFKGALDISAYDLTKPEGAVPLPPSLILKLDSGDSGCLPAMVVDSTVMAEGWLPSFPEAVYIVEGGAPTGEVRRSAASSGAGCCSGGSCCS